ncbi:MAG: NMD3-related protein [Thermoprotei archaeon]|jgi:NMD protein affecting ribosome stability and mRNA decay
MRVCAICGKELENGKGYSRESPHHLGEGNLCAECALSHVDGLPTLIKVRMPKCRICGSVRWKGQWIDVPSGEGWSDLVTSALYGELKDSEGYSVIVHHVGEHKSGARIVFSAEINVGFGLIKRERGELEVSYEPSICPSCSMAQEKNYPYLIQIRGEARRLDREEVSNLRHIVEAIAQRRPEMPLKFDEKEGGVDVQAYSSSFSLNLRHELEKRFLAQTTYSRRLLKKQKDGKLVYQKISLVRLFRLRLGSSVVLEGEVASVEGADGSYLVMRKKNGDEYKLSMTDAYNFYRSRQLEIIKY